jgi:hypothetical protein
MAIGSGIAAQLGVAPETTFGTYVAPTRFYEFATEDLRKTKNIAQGQGLAAGRATPLATRRTVTGTAVEGSVAMEVTNTKFGLILAHLFGGTPTVTQQGATTAYMQSHTVGDNFGKSLSIQVGVPGTNGTVNPYSFLGCKIASAEFSCALGENLTVNLGIDGRDVTEAQALATASYPTANRPFNFGQMTVKLGTYGSETSVTGVKGASATIERPMNTERQYAGSSLLKAEQIWNDFLTVSGSLDTELVTKGDFVDRFTSDSVTSMVLEWVGPLIASTYYETFRLKFPAVYFDEGAPTVGGPDIVAPSVSFTALSDGTNAPVIAEYISTDTTI